MWSAKEVGFKRISFNIIINDNHIIKFFVQIVVTFERLLCNLNDGLWVEQAVVGNCIIFFFFAALQHPSKMSSRQNPPFYQAYIHVFVHSKDNNPILYTIPKSQEEVWFLSTSRNPISYTFWHCAQASKTEALDLCQRRQY